MREENEKKFYIIKFLSEEDAIRAGAGDPNSILFRSISMDFGIATDFSHFFYIVVEETLANLDVDDIKYKKLDISSVIGNLKLLIETIRSEFADELEEDARAQRLFWAE